jgi:murein DD-endopeptidase MepM/ murein hydrolase activator NlpD
MVDNPGGGAAWVRPIDSYTWMRGFAAWHPAVDVAASEGTPVKAANSGRVIFAGWSNWGYGYAVVLAHGPFTTLYAHMSEISVNCGDTVSAGQRIGATGNTGNSSGPHLHFEVRYDDVPQDPTLSVGF